MRQNEVSSKRGQQRAAVGVLSEQEVRKGHRDLAFRREEGATH